MIYSVTNNCRNRLLLNKQRTCLEDDEREYKLKNKVQLTKKTAKFQLEIDVRSIEFWEF